MKAFKASGPLRTAPKGLERAPVERALTNRFSEDVNKAINEKQACLPKAELKIRALEDSFKDEQKFIDTFARGDTKDVVALNVSGTSSRKGIDGSIRRNGKESRNSSFSSCHSGGFT